MVIIHRVTLDRITNERKDIMKTKTKMIARIFLIVCAVLCAALIVAQLLPYWTYENSETETTETISILGYLALPSTHEDVTELLDSSANEDINSLAGTFCIALLLGAVAVIFVILKPKSLWISVWPVAVGIGTLIGYLTEPRWALGSLHILLICLSAALTVASLVPFGIWINGMKYWFMDPKTLSDK